MKKNKIKKSVFNYEDLTTRDFMINERQSSMLVDDIKSKSDILDKIRVVHMTDKVQTYSHLFAQGDFLNPAEDGKCFDKEANLNLRPVKLNAQLFKGKFSLTDSEIRNNASKKELIKTVAQACSKWSANDIAKIAFNGRKREDVARGVDQIDGFKALLEKYGNVYDVSKESDRTVDETKLNAALKFLGDDYDTNNIKWLMPRGLHLDYISKFNTVADATVRGKVMSEASGKELMVVPVLNEKTPVLTETNTKLTAEANADDTTLTVASTSGFSTGDMIVLDYNGKRVIATVAQASGTTITLKDKLGYKIENDKDVAKVNMDGMDIILTDPNNLIIGIHTDGNRPLVEPAREACKGQTSFYYTIAFDVAIDNPKAAVLLKGLKSK